jgi:hypothetical protein
MILRSIVILVAMGVGTAFALAHPRLGNGCSRTSFGTATAEGRIRVPEGFELRVSARWSRPPLRGYGWGSTKPATEYGGPE